jgi:hypothetical protein
LTELLDQFECVAPTGVKAFRERLKACTVREGDPPVEIVVYSWRGPNLLEGKPYAHNQVIEGTSDDAGRIAAELFRTGLNVMIHRHADSYIVAVDNYRFQQR